MDEDWKYCLRPSTGPMRSKSEQTEETVRPQQLSIRPSPQLSSSNLSETRSGLTSYFSPAGWDKNGSAAFGSAENDDSCTSSISVASSVATQTQSPRGATSSRSSEANQLEDLSDTFNANERRAADSVAAGSSAVTLSPVEGSLATSGNAEQISVGERPKEKAKSKVIDCQPRAASPAPNRSPFSLTNANQLLSEWNESPFVSSYPNQHGPAVEVSSDKWTSRGLPWHIDLQDVVTGDMVASGSYGMVFKGIYKDTKVAVKILLIPEASSKRELEKLQLNFRKEIDLWSKLSHPNVVQFVGAYIGAPRWAILTEFLHGGSLRAYLTRQQRKRLPVAVVHSMALDIARGMEYLHENSVMHRDLKSANLLLDENGGLKVADFGSARLEAEDAGNLTAETGTIRWMAPEVICHTPYSRKIDVYSFGIVLWELCTSQLPFEGMSFVQLAHAVANDHHRPATSGLPSSLARLMRQCWDKDATKRPDFAVIVKYLESCGTEGSKSSFKFSQPVPSAEKLEAADVYSRPTTSMRGGQVLPGARNKRPTLAARTYGDALSDDEDWVSIRKECRCSLM